MCLVGPGRVPMLGFPRGRVGILARARLVESVGSPTGKVALWRSNRKSYVEPIRSLAGFRGSLGGSGGK